MNSSSLEVADSAKKWEETTSKLPCHSAGGSRFQSKFASSQFEARSAAQTGSTGVPVLSSSQASRWA